MSDVHIGPGGPETDPVPYVEGPSVSGSVKVELPNASLPDFKEPAAGPTPQPAPNVLDDLNPIGTAEVAEPSIFDSPVVKAMINARAGGKTWGQIQDKLQANTQALLQQGVPQDQIDQTMGFKSGDLSSVETLIDAHAAKAAEQPAPKPDDSQGWYNHILQSFAGGVQETGIGEASGAAASALGHPMPDLTPADQGWVDRVAGMLGMQSESIAAMSAGAAVGSVGGPVGAVAGGLIGYWLDDNFRRTVTDLRSSSNAPIEDIATQMAVRAWESTKSTATVGAAMTVGGPAGAVATGAGLGAISTRLVAGSAEMLAMAAAAKSFGDNLGTAQDWLDQATLLALLHTTSLPGRAKDLTLSKVKSAYNALAENYAATGEPPKAAVARAQAVGKGALIDPGKPPEAPRVMPDIKQIIPPKPEEATGSLEDHLHGLTTRAEADRIQMMQYIASLPDEVGQPPAEGGYQSFDEKAYNHIERPDAVPLDPTEQKIYNQTIQPLRDVHAKLYQRAKGILNGVEQAQLDPNYVPRLAQGKNFEQDRLAGGQEAIPFMGGQGKLSQSTGALRTPTFHTIVDQNGNRVVISEGKPGKITMYDNGEAIPIAGRITDHSGQLERAIKFKGKTYSAFPDHSRVMSKILKELGDTDEIKKELNNLDLQDFGYSLNGHFGETQEDAMRAGAKGSSLRADTMFTDDTGAEWKVVRSNTQELEDNTTTKYHKSAVGNLADSILKLNRVTRNKELADAVTNSSEWLDHATKKGGNQSAEAVAAGWKEVHIPGYEGWLIDPETREKLEDFTKGGPQLMGDRTWAINRIAVGSLFSTPFGMLAHGKNLAGMAAIGRGFDNANVARGWRTGMKAIDDVKNLSPDYIAVLKAKGSLISSGIGKGSMTEFLMNKFGQDIPKDPKRFGPIVKALGLNGPADLASNYMTWMSKELFQVGDILYMQRVNELMEKGMPREAAINETEKYLPTYRSYSRTLGNRFLSKALYGSNTTSFGRFDAGKIKAIASMVTSLKEGITDRDPVAVKDALGRFTVMAIMVTIVAPLINALVQKATGNKNATFNLGGTAKMAEDAVEFAENPSFDKFASTVAKQWVPAIGTKLAVEEAMNTDTFRKQPISEGPAGQQILEKGEYAAQGVVSPAAGAAKDFGKFFRQGLGISDNIPYNPSRQQLREIQRRWPKDTSLVQKIEKWFH